ELDRLRRARLRAGRLHAVLQPVVTEGALLGDVVDRVDLDHPERAGRDAVAAAVADVRRDHDRVELGPDDRAGRADLEAAGLDAVLADVAHHQPAPLRAVGAELLDELDVAPVRAVEAAGVVVGVAGERVGAAVYRRQLVPLVAGDLAGLAADA